MSPSDSPAQPAEQEPNRRVADRYQLERELGRGAMGTVWAAHDEILRRRVAVKEVRLPDGMPAAEADALRERTLREARAIAVLSHPNVITLYDVVRYDGRPFVVMELLASRSLSEVVRAQGPLSVAEAAAVGDAVAAALEAAHRAGITHRDVKPGNVLVGEDGQIKLTDFGIARSVSDHTLTGTGLMLGTPAFIAPEVASGDPATPAADLWGLGALLYAATEGRPPYDVDGDPLETVTEVVQGEIPVPSDDGPLRAVITGLMVKNPSGRLSLAQVRRQLHALLPAPGVPLFQTGLEQPPAPEPSVRPRSRPAISSAAPVSGTGPLPLAADPGPLPFLPTAAPPPPRIGRLTKTVLAFLCAGLFLLAASGGFALARTVAGRSVLPEAPAPLQNVPFAPVRDLKPRSEQAAAGKAALDGKFTISVPQDWVSFREQRPLETSPPLRALPASTLVHFVSADGRQELVVERFQNFYPQYKIPQYIKQLPSFAVTTGGVFDAQTNEQAGDPTGEDAEAPRVVSYRTAESLSEPKSRLAKVDAPATRRTSYVFLVPHGRDLWLVQVTVPTESEHAGRTELFDRIVPTFQVTGTS